jgi:transcriptional regulator of heat shock response
MPRSIRDIKGATDRAAKRSPGIAKAAQTGAKPTAQESVAQTLVQSAALVRDEHSKPPIQNLENVSGLSPTDYTQVSGHAPEVTDSDFNQMLTAIRRKINGVKIMRENALLGHEVEGLRGDLAKMLSARVKAATSVARHEAQIEVTRLEREKALHKALEAEGLEGLRELVTQKAQQEHALRSAQIARLERKTAKLLDEDIPNDPSEALPIGMDY